MEPIFPTQVSSPTPLLPGWPDVLQQPLKFFQTLAQERPDLAQRLGLESWVGEANLPPRWAQVVSDPLPALAEINKADPHAVETVVGARPSPELQPAPTPAPPAVSPEDLPAEGTEATLVNPGNPDFLYMLPVSSAPRKYNRWFAHAREQEIFRIHYRDRLGQERTFAFSLLPAIESQLSLGTSAPNMQGQAARVPEVKPGLLDRLSMKYVRRGVAGAPPAIQSMGIEQRIWQLVGAYLGNEQPEAPEHPGVVYPPHGSTPSWQPVQLNAYEVARFFTEEVVMVGRPVNISILSYRPDEDAAMELYFRGVIQSCRHLHARSDRSYYAFDILLTEYYNATQWAQNNARTYTSGPAVADPAAGSQSSSFSEMPEIADVTQPVPFHFGDE